MERLGKNNNTHLEDFTYKSGAVTYNETFDTDILCILWTIVCK